MNRTPDWLERVLAYDDASPEERVVVDEFLARNPAARDLLERVRRIESGSESPHGVLPDLDSEVLALSPSERTEADASLAGLMERLGTLCDLAEGTPPEEETAGQSGPLDRIRAWWSRVSGGSAWGRLAPVPVFAAAVLFVVLNLGTPDPDPSGLGLGELTVHPAGTVRGGEPGSAPDAEAEGVRVWRTGEAFVLRCPVERPMVPIVFHVDPVGQVVMLHPEDVAGPFLVHPSTRPLELPLPDSEVEWVLEGTPGTETFLLVTAGDGEGLAEVLPSVVTRAMEIGEDASDRQDAIHRLQELLEKEVGEVRTTEIEHDE